ncbi:MAG: hypothetical protein IOC80_09690 [Rhodobacter sp.]|nr:hypothetical protein [Rhodobacter sp.]MCA3519770.1 hypothetical protein [Rhodobacter sp.]MCA3523500.1 hypothetical protein [Rhodobacter sp.]MCA3528252.1 hypothetical protein [Rhodobacter sp.]MCA3534796.1 hypothetical protein [Rhodobacter sp.]
MIKSGTVWVNKSSLGVMNGIVENLNQDIIGWQTTCGFRNGYSESGYNGRELVYVEIHDKDLDLGTDNIAYNKPNDATENADGTLNDNIYINQDKWQTKAQWMATILHELLHGSGLCCANHLTTEVPLSPDRLIPRPL